MDKSVIKNFAIFARKKLIEQIWYKAYTIGILKTNKLYESEVYSSLFDVNVNRLKKCFPDNNNILLNKIKKNGFQEIIEEVAYVWFSRIICMRYMEVNEYIEPMLEMFSYNNPEKLEKNITSICSKIGLDKKLIYKFQQENNIERLLKFILISQCNKMEMLLPEIFKKVDSYVEVLLPERLIGDEFIIYNLLNLIPESDWKGQVEIIGWLYQYYIGQSRCKIDEEIKKGKKVTKEKLPIKTQLFTPEWIVKYMVENTLGRLWLESHYDDKLKSKWKYYIMTGEQKIEVEEKLQEATNKNLILEDIKFFDPCMGSGNILVYAFEVFYEIYKEQGYLKENIPTLILERNLYGLDIDDKAAQIARFALVMKAISKSKDILKNTPKVNLFSIQESNDICEETINYLIKRANDKKIEVVKDVKYLIELFYDAKEYGSLLSIKKMDFVSIEKIIEDIKYNNGIDYQEQVFRKNILDRILPLVNQGKLISEKYHVTVTNPPYMSKGINAKLKKFITCKYNDVRWDLFSVFIERNFSYTRKNGHLGFMTPFVWMFISSYKKLREKIIECTSITSLVQLEYSGFEDATVPICTFTLRNLSTGETGEYIRLSDFKGIKNQQIKTLEAIENTDVNYRYTAITKDFSKIPGSPIVYWVNDKIRNFFSKRKIEEYFYTCTGMQTGDNLKYTRYWYEVDINKTNIYVQNNKYKWNIYNEGGNLRKWYGNQLSLVNWEHNGEEVRKNKSSVIRNERFYYREGITWKRIGSSGIGLRYLPNNFIFDQSGDSMFPEDVSNLKYFLGYLNSKVAEIFFKILSPTLNLTAGNIDYIPAILPKDPRVKYKIDFLVQECIDICKIEWDSYEISWDFKIHPLLKYKKNACTIEEAFSNWSNFSLKQFNRLKNNEEKINEYFIKMFNFQEELDPHIDDKKLTLRKANREKDIKSFISYAVGCIFGRYSLDEDGLVYAGGTFNPSRYKVFKVNLNNIIPITSDENFKDDIVSYLAKFVEITFGRKTLEENLDYIAVTLGKKLNETSMQTIRRYFLKEFYKDHIQIYQRRPIYWMFDCGKNVGFKSLIYIHRYDDEVVSRLRRDYIQPLIRKYKNDISKLNSINESKMHIKEKENYKVQLQSIRKKIYQCELYEKVLKLFISKKININLDDGIKSNYNKFQEIELLQVSRNTQGLNLLVKI